jgi:flagellar hook assembly protein FlgD
VALGYYYKITAVEVGGQESVASVEICVDTGIDGTLPLVTSLSQNYPNPFNPVTTINFSTAIEGNVNLTVYNTAGAVVAKLVEGRMNRGYHSVAFDGASMVSGVYYYTMQLNDKVFTHKMMLLK